MSVIGSRPRLARVLKLPLQFGSMVQRRSVFLCSLIGVAIEICGGSDLSGIASCSSQTGVAIETCGGFDLSWAANLSSQTVGAIETCGGLDLSCIGKHRAELLGAFCWQPGLLCYPLKLFRCESSCICNYLPGSTAHGQGFLFLSVRAGPAMSLKPWAMHP